MIVKRSVIIYLDIIMSNNQSSEVRDCKIVSLFSDEEREFLPRAIVLANAIDHLRRSQLVERLDVRFFAELHHCRHIVGDEPRIIFGKHRRGLKAGAKQFRPDCR